MKVKEILRAIDSFAPFKTAEKWDNSGLLMGDENADVKNVLIALDVTSDVIDDAVKQKCNLIITHHPVIFDPITKISVNDIQYKLIKNDINIISAHSNLDMSPVGINAELAKAIGLQNVQLLSPISQLPYVTITVFVPKDYCEKVRTAMCHSGAGNIGDYSDCTFTVNGEGRFTPNDNANPFIGEKNITKVAEECEISCICPQSKLNNVINSMKSAHPYETPAYNVFENITSYEKIGYGLMGTIDEISGNDFAANVKKSLNVGMLRVVNGNKKVKKVAVLGGSGGNLIEDVIAQGADAFVTGDIKHNYMVEAFNKGLVLIDAGHFATENIALKSIAIRLSSMIPEVKFSVSNASVDPSEYI
ncbi:MAG: Nif3-like dinuclear metal center hexameric protein [Oscillospiraceae bacterium]